MAARKPKVEGTEQEAVTEPTQAQKRYDTLAAETVSVNGIDFAVSEFTVAEAELYDAFYKAQGGQELDLERRALQGDFEKLPRSKTLDVLNKRIVPLRQELARTEEQYEAEGTDELFNAMLELAAKLDPLEDQARKAIEHTDYDKVVRQTDDLSQRANDITTRLNTIRFEFVHGLAVRDGKTAEPIERWRERGTDADKEAAGELVGKARQFIALGRELTPQSAPTPMSSGSLAN